MFAIPLAWLQLKREKMRLLIALAGIGFAVILMFIQLGFQDALFDSSIGMHKELQGDVFLISPQSTAMIAMKSFSQRRLYQTLGYDGVESISPIYLDFALWKNPENRRTRGILVIGFDPSRPIFSRELVSDLTPIRLADVVLFDEKSREEFGPIAKLFAEGKPVVTEAAGRRLTVGGLFSLGASFGADGNIITSDTNFLRIFSRRTSGMIDVGMVTLKPGADLNSLLKLMRQDLQDSLQDVKVLSKAEFIEFERNYWKTSTAIGFIFTLGTAIGFLVGTVIVYQILYTDITDHLAEYATLKAMGYRNSYLLTLVFQEAVILSILGFIPGLLLSLGLYNLTRNATALPIAMTTDRAFLVLCLAMIMCTISGAIAVRKVQDADPADIF
ncbi:FtsX-like permease family protein [Phormidium sp. CLA17]|uniref:ABC transporter permease DevC n=1 Tax=Leptolyngbya sp. Cla-17 TaxID=2803751 RepID=UPI001490EEEB|nr:ABC transporter permease DevC [Leptolyngbya sp. Cla-17]MBM0743519.1 FtsX-like permease family protein [Leptolyngbya sp. Cla-17]